MPRKPRIHFPGAFYHVMLRGNHGQDVFFDQTDRSRFCFLLQEGTIRFGYRIHAFCLMTNHVHLVVQVNQTPLSRIMQNLGFRYTQYFNRRQKKTGHLFQGRYKALLIDAESYLLELVRYIHLNPVRAGVVEQPDAYAWSAHRAYLGLENLPLLTTDWVYVQFGQDADESRRRYEQFVTEGLRENFRPEFHRGSFEGRALGDDKFIEEALTRAEETINRHPSIESIIAAVCSVYRISTAEIASRSRARKVSEARGVVALLVRETEGLALAGLGKCLKQDLSSLSQAARRVDQRLREDSGLQGRIEAAKNNIPICQA
ncbi:MAG: transposase [Desulfuromonadales bacterium]